MSSLSHAANFHGLAVVVFISQALEEEISLPILLIPVSLVSCHLTLKLLPVILYSNCHPCIRWSVGFNKACVRLLFFFSVEISTGPSTMLLSSS